jgi:hypothetical protein
MSFVFMGRAYKTDATVPVASGGYISRECLLINLPTYTDI